jgi:hypothetical protein
MPTAEKFSPPSAQKKDPAFQQNTSKQLFTKAKEPFSSRKGLFLCPDARKYAALSFRKGIFRRHIGGSLAEKSPDFHRVFHIKQHFSWRFVYLLLTYLYICDIIFCG